MGGEGVVGKNYASVNSSCAAWGLGPWEALGYFLGGYLPPGIPNWHPVLKKFPLKLTSRSRNGPIFYTPFYNSP